MLNPASMKQALVEGAQQLKDLNLYEQVSTNRPTHCTWCLLLCVHVKRPSAPGSSRAAPGSGPTWRSSGPRQLTLTLHVP